MSASNHHGAVALTVLSLLSSPAWACRKGDVDHRRPPPQEGRENRERGPIAVQASRSGSRATFSVTFHQDAPSVDIEVKGWGGVEVLGPRVLANQRGFRKGETVRFDVDFRPGPGESRVILSAVGTWGGTKWGETASVVVGEPNEQQRRDRQKGHVVAPDGRRFVDLGGGRTTVGEGTEVDNTRLR